MFQTRWGLRYGHSIIVVCKHDSDVCEPLKIRAVLDCGTQGISKLPPERRNCMLNWQVGVAA
jgi:hypothetical protein